VELHVTCVCLTFCVCHRASCVAVSCALPLVLLQAHALLTHAPTALVSRLLADWAPAIARTRCSSKGGRKYGDKVLLQLLMRVPSADWAALPTATQTAWLTMAHELANAHASVLVDGQAVSPASVVGKLQATESPK